jgi:hypothetical protein
VAIALPQPVTDDFDVLRKQVGAASPLSTGMVCQAGEVAAASDSAGWIRRRLFPGQLPMATP